MNLAVATDPASTNGTRPNIIVIMSDDMGYSDIGCDGSDVSMPNLDALAAGDAVLRDILDFSVRVFNTVDTGTGLVCVVKQVGLAH
jgi:hypothetical protein